MFHHRSAAPEKTKKPKRPQSVGPASKRAEARGSVKKTITTETSKQERLKHVRQQQKVKREEILNRRRLGAGDSAPPPKVVAVIAFHTQADALSLKRRILVACGISKEQASAVAPHCASVSILPPYAQVPGGGKGRVLLLDPPRDVLAALDAVKCADVVLCVLPQHASLEEPAFDALGYKLLTALKAQGLPVVLAAVHGSDDAMSISAKKAADSKKFVSRYVASELGAETKLFQAGTDEEVKALVRGLANATPKDLSWRSDRGYMMAQEFEYSAAEALLCLRGYVRGAGFSCKHPVHLTGYGDFKIARLESLRDPCPLAAERPGAEEQPVRVLDVLGAGGKAIPDLTRLQPFDATMQEQTWPTSEELGEMPPPRAVPKRRRQGAGRIAAPTEDEEGEDGGMDIDDGGGGEEAGDGGSDGEGAASVASVAASTPMTETDEGWDVSSNMTMEVPTSEVVAAERRRRDEMHERSKEDMEFPDEVDYPLDVPAKVRFQKYRGLKSFRTSPWDVYEELPVDYSRIWEFEAFGSTARAVKRQYAEDCQELQDGCGIVGRYCAIFLKDVPPTVLDKQARTVPFVVSGLFECEQKVTVVQGQLKRSGEYSEVIKSKQEVILHCGFRRFPARPTFSEAPRKSSQSKKFRFMRFLHKEQTAAVSFYSPVIFPPCRLMMFLQGGGASSPELELAAIGSVTGADPKQLIIKRAVLTGYPFRVHKSKAVVRFMFFNPTDIRWFKPVELCTKKGLRGHITESLGMHGYMKARFNQHVKQDDTVCMNLYKRVYPKWFPPAWGGRLEDSPETHP